MSDKNIHTDVLIIGASASGLMCAIEAGKRGRKVTVLDHANKAGKKILMSGGGRCNFTNMEVNAENYLSHNKHFCKSALSQYTQWDFISLVDQYKIPYHERSHGQLFCDDSAKDILNMLFEECEKNNVQIHLKCNIEQVSKNQQDQFIITSTQEKFDQKFISNSLVIATGGLSIPKMGATAFGYKIAEQFDHKVWPVFAGLVPFTLQPDDKESLSVLSGIAVTSEVINKPLNNQQQIQFKENILFTHRGLSGPAILQISSYWKPGEALELNLLPEIDLIGFLKQKQTEQPDKKLKKVLSEFFPQRLLIQFLGEEKIDQPLQALSHSSFKEIAKQLQNWNINPNGTEGYRTAEVTLGGVDCDQLSSKTMESKKVNGLYFIGEVVDVTGWLGGYNFQWAWSSGWCAGQVV
ncbi:MAG: NAD(P)/FAD-dependent oxidoreductase [Gammaproteobacteria bacterium]